MLNYKTPKKTTINLDAVLGTPIIRESPQSNKTVQRRQEELLKKQYVSPTSCWKDIHISKEIKDLKKEIEKAEIEEINVFAEILQGHKIPKKKSKKKKDKKEAEERPKIALPLDIDDYFKGYPDRKKKEDWAKVKNDCIKALKKKKITG